MAYVHRLFRWAASRGVIDVNPATDLPKPGKEVRRDRVLTDAELKKVWKAGEGFGWPYGPALQLLILTGARRAEIAELKWGEVNGETIELAGARTKNGEPHSIPLSEPAKQILKTIPRVNDCEYVFGKPLRSGAWSNVKTKFGSADWRIHDIRRTVATGMNELGVEPHIVEAILNHLSGSRAGVAGIYNRAKYAPAKRAALDAWGAHVIELVERTR
jgi:integrase